MAGHAPNPDASDAALSRRADGQRRSVLYAEDQASARIVTTALLERMGFEVVAVEDGEMALEQAKCRSYDLILLDIEMPVMDGVTAARSIRKEADLCRGTPILALSAFLADSTEHCQWRGAFDSALPKPANSNQIRKAVRHALNGIISAPGISEGPGAGWSRFRSALPVGTTAALARTVHLEINHLINGLFACLAAGDDTGAGSCQKALRAMAAGFGAGEILTLLADRLEGSPGAAAGLLGASKNWHARQFQHETAICLE
jgi:CheY-like chemotaxis protein